MCISPKYIVNRSLHYDLFKPLKMAVPCGKCEECRLRHRNDWFVRCYYQWKMSNYRNVFFYTLTYNNDNLPHIMKSPCFSKRHVQLFLKKLRYRLDKLGLKMKYMVTCEYGELTHRPHYHVLFFFEKDINPYWLLRFITDSWSYGFVKSGDNVGQVTSASAIQYVTKYVTKSLESYDQIYKIVVKRCFYRYYNLLNWLFARYDCPKGTIVLRDDGIVCSRSIDSSPLSDDAEEWFRKFITKIRNLVNQVQPFHLQSTKLGANAQFACDATLEQVPVISNNGSCHMYRLPRYISRLLWYDVVEDENTHKRTKFVLSESGKIHQFEKYAQQIKDDTLRYDDYFAKVPTFSPDLLLSLNAVGKRFQNLSSFIHWWSHFDLDIEILSIYKHVFRGRVCTLDDDSEVNALSIKEYWRFYAWECLEGCSNLDYGEICKDFALQISP